MDKKLIIHVCAEVAAVGCVFFYLNSKITNKDEVIARLEKENKELLARIEKIEKFLIGATRDQQPLEPEHPPVQPSKKKKKKPTQEPGTTSDEESVISV